MAGAAGNPEAAALGNARSAESRRQAKIIRQERFLSHIAKGVSGPGALVALGAKPSTLQNWRREPDFEARYKALVDGHRKGRGRAQTKGDPLSFQDFRKRHFGYDTPVHHQVMLAALIDQPADTVTLVLAPPESGKTSVLIDWINWTLAAVDPDHRIAVMSESADLARKIVGQVANRMTDWANNTAYIDAYGPFRIEDRNTGYPWNAHALRVWRSTHDQKDPSLEARGAGSRIYGARYDKVHLDDIQSLETLSRTKALYDSARQTIQTRLVKGVGSVSIWGSRVGPGDVYEAMMGGDYVDRLVKLPALTKPLPAEEHFVRDELTSEIRLAPGCPELSYWPEHWTMLDLARRRAKVGERIWSQTYMQDPVSAEGATFPHALVSSCCDLRRRLGDVPPNTEVFVSLDPSLAGNAVFTVLAMDQTHLYLVDQISLWAPGSNENLFAALSRVCGQYRPTECVIEQDGSGNKALLADQRLDELAGAFGFRKHAHVTTRNKSNHQYGVASMATSFARREIVLPYAEESHTRRVMGDLIRELTDWRADVPTQMLTQDRTMSIWFGWFRWMERRRVLTGSTEAWRRVGLAKPSPYVPIFAA